MTVCDEIAPQVLPAGTVLTGRYVVSAPLGAGGMGEVYRAHDERLSRDVAIKILPDRIASDPAALSRFQREAKLLAALSHPNILTIYDFGTDQGISYAVMELLKGETLRSRIRKAKISWNQTVDIMLSVAEGLSAAHSAGIIHRDIKPENIFLNLDDRVKILDFGLARSDIKVSDQEVTSAPTVSRQTSPNVVLGTVPYMSPEQVRGDPVDFRTDLFSLGCILHEMLTGTSAFLRETSPETMTAIMKEDPPLLPQNVPAELARVVSHCLEKKPENRFQSARDLSFNLQSVRNTATVPLPQKANRPFPIRSLGISVAIIIFLLAGGWWLKEILFRPQPGEKSIAVLPFSPFGDSKEEEYFSDGMTEDIITQLSKIADLKVISRTSTMPYKKSGKSLRQIAKELGVGTILEGSVRRSRNRVRIVAQLIDAQTDKHIWADTYDRDLQDVFVIQSDVAQRIASALRAELSPSEKAHIEHRPTQNLAAYDYYLRARESSHRFAPEDNERAIEYYNKALKLDPTFAAAYAGLADAFCVRVTYGRPESSFDNAIEMAGKAISIDPTLAEGYEALGYAYQFKGWAQKAIAALQKALSLNPNYARALGVLGKVYLFQGRLDETLPLMMKYAELDPTSAVACRYIGNVYDALQDFPRAKDWYLKSILLDPAYMEGYWWLIQLDATQGNLPEAQRTLQKALTISPNSAGMQQMKAELELFEGNYDAAKNTFEKLPEGWANLQLGYILWKQGKPREASKKLETDLQYLHAQLKTGNESPYIRGNIAQIHSISGNRPEAIRWLKEAVRMGYLDGSGGLMKQEYFENLRQDPEFQQLATQVQSRVDKMRQRVQQQQKQIVQLTGSAVGSD